jgi:hypothetical protein
LVHRVLRGGLFVHTMAKPWSDILMRKTTNTGLPVVCQVAIKLFSWIMQIPKQGHQRIGFRHARRTEHRITAPFGVM